VRHQDSAFETLSLQPAKEMKMTTQDQPKVSVTKSGGDAVYAIGLIGACIYYFKHANTTQDRFLAFFKGLVWPAFLVYALLASLEKE
jgi:hypothetical protein